MNKLCDWCHKNKVEDQYWQCDECVQKKARKITIIFDPLANIGRANDIKQLKEMRTKANKAERIAIDKSLYKINHEDRRKKSMREALIKATRNHDHPNIKGIHEDIAGKSWYQNHE